jgi:hypothetical protein
VPGRRRAQPICTIAAIDLDTPVVDLYSEDDTGRDSIVLFDDGQRARLRFLDERAERFLEVSRMRVERERWHDRWWARLVAILAATAALGQTVADWVFRARGR